MASPTFGLPGLQAGTSAKEISPIAIEAVKRIDAVFAFEREINGHDPAVRLAVRQRQSAPLVEDLASRLRAERALLSKHAKVAKAIDGLLAPDHWPSFKPERYGGGTRQRFVFSLEDGRVCLTNNCAERSLALGRRSWLFASSEPGGQRAAFMYTLIGTALCRARHRADYADPRTMPNAHDDSYENGVFSILAIVVGPGAFGIVWLFTRRSRIPADDH